MNHQTIGFLAVVFIAITGCQSEPVQFTTEDEATLRGIVEATARDFGAGDMETWSQQYANDAVFQPPNAPMVVGQANILALGQAFPPLENLTFSNITVSGEGNIGYGTSNYDMVFRPGETTGRIQATTWRCLGDSRGEF
jgi:ketosteroid isomerase-like protein